MAKKLILVVAGIIAAAVFVLITTGEDMSSASKRVLFSQVEGVITKDGVPVVGAEVEQIVLYKSENKVPRVTVLTDSEGRFVFAEVSTTDGPKLLPGETTVTQSLVINHEGNEYQGWNHGKKGKEANTESGGRPMKLICELNDEPDSSGTSYGICRLRE